MSALPPPRPDDLTPRRCERTSQRPGERLGGKRRQFRLRRAVAAFYALMACPTFIAGLWGTGEYGSAWYGFAGTVLAIGLLWWSEVLGRWMP